MGVSCHKKQKNFADVVVAAEEGIVMVMVMGGGGDIGW